MNLFKKFVFLLILFLSSYYGFSQEISIRGGFNLSQIHTTSEDMVLHTEFAKLNPGFNVGTTINIPLQNIFSVETGFVFSSKGNKLADDPNNYLIKENTYYLDIPALLKVTTAPIRNIQLVLMAGAYAGYGLYGNVIWKTKENSVVTRHKNKIHWGNEPNEYDRFDYGLKFGAGIKVKKYQIGAFYELGLKDFSNDMTFESRNRVLEFYIAYEIKNFRKSRNH